MKKVTLVTSLSRNFIYNLQAFDPKVILLPSCFDQSFIGLGSHKHAPV